MDTSLSKTLNSQNGYIIQYNYYVRNYLLDKQTHCSIWLSNLSMLVSYLYIKLDNPES